MLDSHSYQMIKEWEVTQIQTAACDFMLLFEQQKSYIKVRVMQDMCIYSLAVNWQTQYAIQQPGISVVDLQQWSPL